VARVLIEGINYAPEPIGVGRYTTEIAEYLVSQGHQVDVVTAVPHYPGWRLRYPYRPARYYFEERAAVRIARCPLLLHASGTGIWRLLMPLSFALAAVPVLVWRILKFRPQVVLCVEPTLLAAPAAILAAKMVRARCVLHVQDLEVDSAFAVKHLSGRLLEKLAYGFERIVLRRFDVVITISHSMCRRLAAKGVAQERLRVVRNWVDTTRIKHVPGANAFRQQLNLRETDFVVLYSGHIGPKQALDVVFRAAELTVDRPGIWFVVAGDGPLAPQYVKQYGHLPNLHFLPVQPEEKLCDLMNLADLHLLTQDAAAGDLVLPSKLAALLASGRPVLATAEENTELHSLLAGAAILIPPGQPAALAQAIIGARSRKPELPRWQEVSALFARDRNLPGFCAAIWS
jgi:colanic acid biosynthesis glycosyl transferase WcaI